MRAPSVIFAAALTFAAAPIRAETLYVEDKLVLNVYAEADQSSPRIATIQTGDAVEALERSEKFVRVQLADGREGWVGASYLSEQPPAVVQLRELQSKQSQAGEEANAKLTAELAKLKKQNAALEAEIASLKQALAASQEAAQAAAAPAPPVHVENEPAEPLPSSPPVAERSSAWTWLLALIGAGAGGFAAGWQTLGKRVRARFGGVKVY
jgi:uncharacterized protein YgiM (DUF1202 family)